MLLMLLIGWTILLPAIVVAGLYVGSTVLGRRGAALRAYEDLLPDEDLSGEEGRFDAFEPDIPEMAPAPLAEHAGVIPLRSSRSGGRPVGAGH